MQLQDVIQLIIIIILHSGFHDFFMLKLKLTKTIKTYFW